MLSHRIGLEAEFDGRYIFRALALIRPQRLFGIFLAARLRPGGI